jgi:D-amino-acid dehydrogenase
MKLRLRAIPSLLTWGVGFLRNSSNRRYLSATLDNYRLARYSLEKTLRVTGERNFKYDFSDHGTLCIFQDAAPMAERRQVGRHLADLGLAMQELDVDQVVDREPLLAPIRERLVGGIWFPDDARGDAHLFCRELAVAIVAAGGEIRTDTIVSGLSRANGRINGVIVGGELVPADRVVVAAGSYSPKLLASVGQSVAVKPAKGYSITADASELGPLPNTAVVDDSSHAVITAFGSRLRVCGTAEFTGFDKRLTRERVDNLFRVLESVFPELAARVDGEKIEAWAGLRPMSNDGRPFIGAGAVEGLYINTGHGALGWTMAMGSANVLADLICGKTPETDHLPFDVLR